MRDLREFVTFRRFRLAVAAFLLAATLSIGASVGRAADASVNQARVIADMRARVAAIGTPAPSKAAAKEAKNLTKAATGFEAFALPVNLTTAPQLVAPFRALKASRTMDPAILDSGADYVADLIACILQEDVNARLRVAEIYVIAERLKSERRLTAARADLDAAVALAQSDAAGAFNSLAIAAAKYAKAVKLIEKVLLRLESQLLPRIDFPLDVRNQSGKAFTVTSIVFDVLVTPNGGGTPIRVTADWRDHVTLLTGPKLPFTFSGQSSDFDLYPTFLQAMIDAQIPNTIGGRAVGSMRFVSVRFGTVDVPIDLTLSPIEL